MSNEISKFEFEALNINTDSISITSYDLYQDNKYPYITISSTSNEPNTLYGLADRESFLPPTNSSISDRTFTISYDMSVDNYVTVKKTKTVTDVIQSFTFPSNNNFFSDSKYSEFLNFVSGSTEYLPVHLRYDNNIENWGCIGTFGTVGVGSYSDIKLADDYSQTNYWKKLNFPNIENSNLSLAEKTVTYATLNSIENTGITDSVYYTYTEDGGVNYTLSKDCPIAYDSTGFLNFNVYYNFYASTDRDYNNNYIYNVFFSNPYFNFIFTIEDILYSKEKQVYFLNDKATVFIMPYIENKTLTETFTFSGENIYKTFSKTRKIDDGNYFYPGRVDNSFSWIGNKSLVQSPVSISYNYSLSKDISILDYKFSITNNDAINYESVSDNYLYMANTGSFTTEFLPNETGIINTFIPDTTKGNFNNFSIAKYVHSLPYSFTTTTGQYSTYLCGGSGTTTTTSAIFSNSFNINELNIDTDTDLKTVASYKANLAEKSVVGYINGSTYYSHSLTFITKNEGGYLLREDLNNASFTGYLEIYNDDRRTYYLPLYKSTIYGSYFHTIHYQTITGTNFEITGTEQTFNFNNYLGNYDRPQTSGFCPVSTLAANFNFKLPDVTNILEGIVNNYEFFFTSSVISIYGSYGDTYCNIPFFAADRGQNTAAYFPLAYLIDGYNISYGGHFDDYSIKPHFSIKKIKTIDVKNHILNTYYNKTTTTTVMEVINDFDELKNVIYSMDNTITDLITSTTIGSCTESIYTSTQTISSYKEYTTKYLTYSNTCGAFTSKNIYRTNTAFVKSLSTDTEPANVRTTCNFIGNASIIGDKIETVTKVESLFECGYNENYSITNANFSEFNNNVVTGFYYNTLISSNGGYVTLELNANVNGMTFSTIVIDHPDTIRDSWGSYLNYPLFSGDITLPNENGGTYSLRTYLDLKCLSTVPLDNNINVNIPIYPKNLSAYWPTNTSDWKTNSTNIFALKTFTANISYGEGCTDASWSSNSIVNSIPVYTHYNTVENTITK